MKRTNSLHAANATALGTLPRRCDLPAGTGKTSIATIWLLALARQAAEGPPSLPRRLVYVVNRRTVVDQATDEVEKLAIRLADAGSGLRSGLKDVAEALESLRAFPAAGPSAPVYVSTLRGQRADNGLWKRDPAAPAVVMGTVDMVGSRLLFSEYGDGKYHRPLHAGLPGIDTLIVHDEAHLTPAFGHLLGQITAGHSQGLRHKPASGTGGSKINRGWGHWLKGGGGRIP